MLQLNAWFSLSVPLGPHWWGKWALLESRCRVLRILKEGVLRWAGQMVMLLVLGPGAAYEAKVGLVGSTLMGRSQLKVSTGTCSGPVQVTGSGCSTGGRSPKPGSRDVTNSKCNRHFRDTGIKT